MCDATADSFPFSADVEENCLNNGEPLLQGGFVCWQHTHYEDVNISLVPVIKMSINLVLNVSGDKRQRTQHSGGMTDTRQGPYLFCKLSVVQELQDQE